MRKIKFCEPYKPSFYQMMVADGRIENLSPYLEEDEEWRNMIEPAVMEGCTDEDGNIYLGPGGYKFMDYVKAGTGLVVVCFVVSLVVIPVIWPFFPGK